MRAGTMNWVSGAPFAVGDVVRVVRPYEPGDRSIVGRLGVVVALEYGLKLGERFPDDPGISVRFAGLPPSVLFWQEELRREEASGLELDELVALMMAESEGAIEDPPCWKNGCWEHCSCTDVGESCCYCGERVETPEVEA